MPQYSPLFFNRKNTFLMKTLPTIHKKHYYRTVQNGFDYQLGLLSANTATISSDFIVSGFAKDKYLAFPTEYKSTNNAEYIVKFTTGDTIDSKQAILHCECLFQIEIFADGALTAYNWEEKAGTIVATLSPNTTYWAKVVVNGTTKSHSYSTDGITYSTPIVLSDSVVDPTKNYQLRVGVSSYDLDQIFTGTVDLKECSISIDGKHVWSGVEIRPHYELVEVSSDEEAEYSCSNLVRFPVTTVRRIYYTYLYWKQSYNSVVQTTKADYSLVTTIPYFDDSKVTQYWKYFWDYSNLQDYTISATSGWTDAENAFNGDEISYASCGTTTDYIEIELASLSKINGVQIIGNYVGSVARACDMYVKEVDDVGVETLLGVATGCSIAPNYYLNLSFAERLVKCLRFYLHESNYEGNPPSTSYKTRIQSIQLLGLKTKTSIAESDESDYDFVTETQVSKDTCDFYEDIVS